MLQFFDIWIMDTCKGYLIVNKKILDCMARFKRRRGSFRRRSNRRGYGKGRKRSSTYTVSRGGIRL